MAGAVNQLGSRGTTMMAAICFIRFQDSIFFGQDTESLSQSSHMFVRRLLPIFVIASSALGQSPGEAVLRRMHDAYSGRWYSTLRFVQKTTQYRADGSTNIATWYESLRQTREGVT